MFYFLLHKSKYNGVHENCATQRKFRILNFPYLPITLLPSNYTQWPGKLCNNVYIPLKFTKCFFQRFSFEARPLLKITLSPSFSTLKTSQENKWRYYVLNTRFNTSELNPLILQNLSCCWIYWTRFIDKGLTVQFLSTIA